MFVGCVVAGAVVLAGGSAKRCALIPLTPENPNSEKKHRRRHVCRLRGGGRGGAGGRRRQGTRCHNPSTPFRKL